MLFDAVLSVFAGILTWAAISDATRLRIPNTVPVALLVLYPLYLVSSGDTMQGLPALGVAAIVFALGFVFFARGWMGGGDVKLLSVGALWAGPHLIGDFLIVASLVGGVQALASVLRLRNLLPHWAALSLASLASTAPVDDSASGGAPAAGNVRARTRQRTLPYGIAIACGGLYVAGRLAGIITV
jgi:prepilin peptidase CpaA